MGGSCRGPGVETGVEAGFGVIGRPIFVVCGPGFEAAAFVSLAGSLGVGRFGKLGSLPLAGRLPALLPLTSPSSTSVDGRTRLLFGLHSAADVRREELAGTTLASSLASLFYIQSVSNRLDIQADDLTSKPSRKPWTENPL